MLRVRIILEALRHLAAVLRADQPVADEVLEGGLVEEGGGEDHEGIEPAACLIDALGDKVRGEGLLELLLVLKGVVHLGEVWVVCGVSGSGWIEVYGETKVVHTSTATRRIAWAMATPHQAKLNVGAMD